MPKPANHLFEVEIIINQLLPENDSIIDFILPVWRSGRYVIFNFPSGIQEFSAYNSSGEKLKWNKTDKSTWRVKSASAIGIKVKYKVYSNDFISRTRGLNDEHGFIDASAVFMYIEKFRRHPVEIKIIPYNDWHITTGLDKSQTGENIYTAPGYDYLADCPIEIGTQKDYDFYVNGKKHTASFSGKGNYNADTVIKDLTKIIEANYIFWGDLPYNHFTFIFHMTTQTYGGTEHINSFVMDVPPFLFKNKMSYLKFLSTCSHEFFHTWNVKQLRPKTLVPYDFKKENYTDELWIAEGTTSYYSDILLLRAGYSDSEWFFSKLVENIENDIERPGNRIQSLQESSFDAWIKFWNNTPNKWIAETDYYAKGENVSLLLDLEIRNNSLNRYSLDDVMRSMYERFPLDNGGYTNADFIKTTEEFAGGNLEEFFSRYLYDTDSLEWNKYLSYAGLNLNRTVKQTRPYLGIGTEGEGDKLIVSFVIPESPAGEAGLENGDEIIAFNGYKITENSLGKRVADLEEGDIIKLTIMRNDKLKEIYVTIKNKTDYNYEIIKVDNPSRLQKSIYESWLNLNWEK